MTVTAPETALRQRLIALLTREFRTEAIEFKSDKIHDSLGQDTAIGGVYPGPASEKLRNGLVQDTIVYVQLFNQWEPRIDPTQAVDPTTIETWAERIRRACRVDDDAFAGDSHLWFYRVLRVEYPPDPTGNISRLLAQVSASSQNAGLVETSG